MLSLKELLQKQTKLILSSRTNALLYAVILALLPYCTWLAMTVIALVTLRKGEREGGRILLSVLLAHALMLLTSLPLYAALFNSVLVFVPIYLAAYVLRATKSWQAVATLLFFLVIVSSVIIQQMVPEWVISQYTVIQNLVKASQSDQMVVKWLEDAAQVPLQVMANYLLGIQLVFTIVSVWSALMLARSLQSQLFYSGGFTKEVLSFRGNRLSCMVMISLILAAWQWNILAMNVLPVLGFFYFLAGLSLCANFIMTKSSKLILAVLVVPLIFIPFLMMPLYIILGLLDSIFNIRLTVCR